MSSPYKTNTIIDRFRLQNSILRGLFVYSLILAMFMPSAELVASVYFGRSTIGTSGGGNEKDATIHFYNGSEWTTALLAMEAQPEVVDTAATSSPLFYHNGIMWVKTDMVEEDVKGARITKVNLPLERLAGKPDAPAEGLTAELTSPAKVTTTETASGEVVAVVQQPPSSKLEKDLGTNKTANVPTKSITLPAADKPIINNQVKSVPVVKEINKPIADKEPVTIAPVVAKEVSKPAVTPVAAPTPAPVKKSTTRTLVIPAPSKTPVVVHDAAPAAKPVTKPFTSPTATTNKPNVTEAPALVKTETKPVVKEDKPVVASKPASIVDRVPVNKPVMVPMPVVTNDKPNTAVTPNLAKTETKPVIKEDKPIVTNKPSTSIAPVVANKPVMASMPVVTNNRPNVTVASKLVDADAKPIPTPRPEKVKISSVPVIAAVPVPLRVKPDGKPVMTRLNYNLAPPHPSTVNSTIANRPEKGPIKAPPANFVFALSKQGGAQLPQDTVPKPKPSALTDFIQSGADVEPTPEAETIQDPKPEAKKDDKKKDKKKEDEPAPAPITLDTIRKLIQEEVSKSTAGQLPVSAIAPPKADTATVPLPPVLTVNDSIEELRKLNEQLQVELDEKLMLRDKLEGQVDQQRQIKKEAKLQGDLGKKDTIKLEGSDSYVVREHKFALNHEIFGWHPHWMGDSYRKYDYSLLTTLAYFSYELNPNTGGYKTIHDWNETDVVELAQDKGCKVVLTVTCLNEKDLSLFLANPAAQDNFVKTIRGLIVERNANGVNINFEKLNYRYKRELVNLMEKLRNAFDALNPDYQISITVPAIDYAGAYDVEAMEPFVDLFVMMGYEYTGSYSSSTGPTSPMNGGAKYAQYGLESSIDAYLKNKVPAKKLILAIPYFGVQWEVEGKEVPGKSIKFIRSLSYAQIKAMFPDREPLFYEASLTPYFNSPIAGRYNMFDQIWFDNARSLGMKFDLIVNKELGGVGIWALGMDGGNKEFWNVLEDKFLQIVPVPIDTIEISKAQSGPGVGSWFKSRFNRLLSVLRRPSTFNPATSNFDNWLRTFMMIGGFMFIVSRAQFVIRRLQMGQQYRATKPYLYVMITGIAILTISLLMWARITQFFERVYHSSSFLFTIGLIIGIIAAVIFILWILPKWLKNKELP